MSEIIALMLLLLMSLFFQPAPPDALALLPAGTHTGVLYSSPDDAARPSLDAAFTEVYQEGADIYELSIAWSDLEPAPGVIQTEALESSLDLLASLDIQVYLSITTINTVALTIPADLAAAPDLKLLADGRHFDDPVMIERFAKVLDAVVPLLVEANGFFISVGNEVEGWLEYFPGEIEPFARFVAAARDHIHQIAPGMGAGATITYGGIVRKSPVIPAILAVSDAAALTYYPINDDFTVRDPNVTADDLKLMIEAAGDLPVLFQEVGYPSGYLPGDDRFPGVNDSSGEKQRAFIEQFFEAAQAYPRIRMISVLQLADWSDQECDAFVRYYGVDLPAFREYLCSLGVRRHDGSAKPAYEALLKGIRSLAQQIR